MISTTNITPKKIILNDIKRSFFTFIKTLKLLLLLTNLNMSFHFPPILMMFLISCQLEGVDEEGLKEREVELEQRRIRKKIRDDLYRCAESDKKLEILVSKAFQGKKQQREGLQHWLHQVAL